MVSLISVPANTIHVVIFAGKVKRLFRVLIAQPGRF